MLLNRSSRCFGAIEIDRACVRGFVDSPSCGLKHHEIRGACHLAKKSGNFGLKSNGKVIFRKIRSEIVDYLQR